MINIKKAKNILIKALSDVIKSKLDKEDFKLLLRYFYTHKSLQMNATNWIRQIENAKACDFRTIIINNKATKFYYAWSTYKDYKYYVNSLGIVLLRKSKDENDYEYSIKNKNKLCWFLEIDKSGCIEGYKFNNTHKNCPKIQNGAIYKELISKGFFYPYEKEKNELIDKMNNKQETIVLHHITSIEGTDARDNRIDNIICLPSFLHGNGRHSTNISNQDKKRARRIICKKYI